MEIIKTHNRNSILLAASADKIMFQDNCNLFDKDIVSNYNLNSEYNTAISLYPYSAIKKISVIYILDQKEEIENFLIINKGLSEVLLEAQVQIECRFGDAPLYLQLHTDFENQEWTKLFLIIKSNLPNDEATSRFEDLLKKWFFQKDKKIKKLLTISEE